MKRALLFVITVIAVLIVCSCGAAESNTPVLTPAVEAAKPLPAPENSMPLTVPKSTSAPETQSSETAQNTDDAPLKLYLNGNRLVLDAPPVKENGVVMVPVAEICAAFSREITAEQNGDTLTLVDVTRENTIILASGSSEALLNGKPAELDAPCLVSENGSLFMPLTAFRTLFDADNKFTEEYSSAYIMESGLC